MKRHSNIYILFIVVIMTFISCEDLIEIDTPHNQLVTDNVFKDTTTIHAAVLGMYAKMANPDGTQGGLGTNATMFNGMSADEIHHFYSFLYGEFVTNSLLPDNIYVDNYWGFIYNNVYTANALIEGLETSTQPETYIAPLIGEAKFIRAMCYFYLVNSFGDVPLVLETNPAITAELPRADTEVVYTQIKTDLLEAIAVLPEDFRSYGGEKIRATTGAAQALLARVYLYMKDWENAEITASEILRKTDLYHLEPDPGKVFLANSQEGILQFVPAFSSSIWMASAFYPSAAPNFVLNDGLTAAFEEGDYRRFAWTIDYNTQGDIYPHSAKYKRTFSNPSAIEYNQVFRVAEQYLIRAEARAQQNNFDEATEDINKIRRRANLDDLRNLNTKEALIAAIEQEKRIEFFCEWGHRWFDLKRWPGRIDPSVSRADEILSEYKGDNWQTTDQLFPIPQASRTTNPNLSQNPGYTN